MSRQDLYINNIRNTLLNISELEDALCQAQFAYEANMKNQPSKENQKAIQEFETLKSNFEKLQEAFNFINK